jgi:ankyrin repeat protein
MFLLQLTDKILHCVQLGISYMSTPANSFKQVPTYFSQHWFMDKMKHMGYEITDGQCAGISYLGMQAFLANDADTFIKRLQFIHDKDSSYFQLIKKNMTNFNYKKPKLVDKFSPYDLYAFFDGVRLIQSSYIYKHLAQKNTKLLQMNIPHASLVSPVGYGKSRSNDIEKPVLVDKISGAYTKDELCYCLDLLANYMSCKTSLLLYSSNHAININYDPKTNVWLLIDANHLPAIYFNDTKLLAEQIINSFKAGVPGPDNAIFTTHFYTLSNQAKLLKDNVKSLKKNADWKAIHGVNSNKLNLKDAFNSTWLYIAASGGHTNTVEQLLHQDDINVNTACIGGNTPILIAAQNGHIKVVGALLAHKDIKVNVENSDGETALLLSAQNGHDKIVDDLLDCKKTKVNKANNNGVTPLYLAAQNGHCKVVNALLLHKKIKVNKANDKGITPLFMAAQNGHVKAVELLLLQQDIKINATTNVGATPLYIAAQQGHIEIVNTLLAHEDIIVNAKMSEGYTPLHIASQNGHIKVVKALLAQKGIRVNSTNVNGATPLTLAVQNGHRAIVNALLENGAHANIATKSGATPLYFAARNGYKDIVEHLLKNGANTNAACDDGVSPLYIAVQNGHADVVELLLKNGANVNAAGITGHTPIQVACLSPHTKGNKKIFSSLLENGADITHRNDDGQTAMMIAKKVNNLTAQYMITHHKLLEKFQITSRFFKHETSDQNNVNAQPIKLDVSLSS